MAFDSGTLRDLAERGSGHDRAFVDGVLRMRWARAGAGDERAERAELAGLHDLVIAAAARAHESLRARITVGALRGSALRARLEEGPSDERDHFVEEVLGVAYPPLAEAAPERELITYCPSGYDEIVHALDVTGLAPGDRFLDIGSGAGKAVLLSALLHGAKGLGIERDEAVFRLSTSAAKDLDVEARFVLGDARAASWQEPADVVFMYLPFTGGTLAAVLRGLLDAARTWAQPPRFLCAGALDLGPYPELVPAGEPRSWLHVYAWR